MTPEEKFTFDLEGYLVVKGVLSQAEVDEVNALADRAWPGAYDESGIRRVSDVSRWGAATQRCNSPAVNASPAPVVSTTTRG